MRVLHLLDHSMPVMSGYSTRSRSIVSFQRALGIDPVVVTSAKHPAPGPRRELIDGVLHYRTPRVGGGLPYVGEVRLMSRLARRIVEVGRAEGVDLIHSHSPVLNGFPALWAGRRLRVPVVYEARAFWEDAAVDHGVSLPGSVRYRLTRALETWLFRRVHAGVTICEGMRRDLVARGIEADRLHVVPNGVDTEWFRPQARSAELAKRLGLNGGPVFGFIGSFYRYEGLKFLLDAVPALRQHLPHAQVLLVGGGQEEPELRSLARAHSSAVIMPGAVPHQKVRDVYSVIDVFVCPRRRSRLTELVTPLKPLEAMSMERPVLASDVGGLTELIAAERTGLLFDADSAERFVDQAVRAGSDSDLRERLGREARVDMTQTRSWREIITRYKRVYASATACRGHR